MNKILDTKPNDELQNFLDLCSSIRKIDADNIRNIINQSVRYLRNHDLRPEMLPLRELELKWYSSLDNGDPDYSVYDSDLYLAELWSCWVVYSRKYLIDMNAYRSLCGRTILSDLGSVNKAIDLGCGIGYTTAALKDYFPDADVIGTNLDDTFQIQIARQLGNKYHFRISSDIEQIAGSTDFIFASEYFERIQKPIDHLYYIIYLFKPRRMFIANSFTVRSIGHFDFL